VVDLLNRWLLPLASIVLWILCWVVSFIRVTHWMEFATLYVFLILILSVVQFLKEQRSKTTGIWLSAQVDIRERLSLPIRVFLTVILCFFSTIIYLIVLSDVSLSWLIWNMLAATTTALTIFLTQDETDEQNQIFLEPSN
jgi:hypothetical protein